MICPLCRSSKNSKLFISSNTHGRHRLSQEKFTILKCHSCACIFPKIQTNKKYFNKYYSSSYYPSSVSRLSKLISSLSVKTKINNLLKLYHSKKNIKILDIGCGGGEFLSFLPDKYFKKNGLDTNPDSIKICQSKNINVIKADITSTIRIKENFDIITLNHVFEHLSSPNLGIKNIHHLLKPKAYLVLSVPLTDSIGYQLGRQNWFHLDTPRHLFIPNRHNITSFLESNHFIVKKIYHQPFEFPLDLFWSLRHNFLFWPLYILYPIIKLFDWETATFICQKK